jgi:hypothetical protein
MMSLGTSGIFIVQEVNEAESPRFVSVNQIFIRVHVLVCIHVFWKHERVWIPIDEIGFIVVQLRVSPSLPG